MTLEEKWAGLARTAHDQLACPCVATGEWPVLRVWEHPSFTPWQSWTLVQQPASWLVRRMTWDHNRDYARVADPLKRAAFLVETEPRPSVEHLDRPWTEAEAHGVLARLSDLTVPLWTGPRPIGLDGTMYGIETEGRQVRLEWWCDGPPAWNRLTSLVETLRQTLDAAFGDPA